MGKKKKGPYSGGGHVRERELLRPLPNLDLKAGDAGEIGVQRGEGEAMLAGERGNPHVVLLDYLAAYAKLSAAIAP